MPRIYLTHFDACAQERFFMSNLTLSQFLQQEKGNLTPELAQVIDTIAATCKTIDQALQKVPWLEFWVAQVTKMFKVKHKKLDVISNDYLIDALKVHPHVGGLASEELDDFTPAQENGEYLVLFDPLDGSSNIDINMCVGTIFSILPAKNAVTQAQDFMQAGTQQVAAGYVFIWPINYDGFNSWKRCSFLYVRSRNSNILTYYRECSSISRYSRICY